jgi:hypothetical protein
MYIILCRVNIIINYQFIEKQIMKKYLGWFVILLMLFAIGANTARAKDDNGNGKDDRADAACRNGGFATLKDASGNFFTTEQACVDFFNKDIEDKDETMCKNGGFAVLNDAAGNVFTTEQACVAFFNKDDNEGGSDNSGKGNNNALRDAAKQKLEALREQLKNEKDAAKARIKEARINGRENALQRFDAAVARISALKDRVNVRIAALEAKGVDVTNAKIFVATAETKLTAAAGKITEINALLAVSINELSAADKTKLRTLANDTQTLIKDAHQALRDAVKSLKDMLKIKMDAEATTN